MKTYKLQSVPLDLALKCAVVSPSLTIACCIERVIAKCGRSSPAALQQGKKLHGMMHLNETKMTGRSFSRGRFEPIERRASRPATTLNNNSSVQLENNRHRSRA